MKTGDFKELIKIKNHYKSVVGVSKMFNPELCRDKEDKSNADKIAELKLFHRTPAYKYQSEIVGNVFFSIWYVRIREKEHSASPFSGVLKIEKILITDDEIENGLDSQEVDLITANIINERNPVCYGKDDRWANHLYPVYLTETSIKSKHLSNINFFKLKYMDIITLVTTALSFATPFLVKTGEKIAENIGEDIWNLLKKPFSKKEQDTLETNIQNDSEKETIIEAIIVKINSDQQYKTELENAVIDAKKTLIANNLQIVNNNGNIEKQVNIQNVTGNITL
jgi:hypothetical protein